MSKSEGMEAAMAALAKCFEGDPEYDVETFFDRHGMCGVEARVLAALRKEWLERIEYWLAEVDQDDDWLVRRLTDEANTLRRRLGIPRPRERATVREQTRERVRRFRQRQKERKLVRPVQR